MEPTPAPPGQLQIALIRHGRPLVDRTGLFNHRRATDFINQYDLADVEAFTHRPDGFNPDGNPKVFCSPLNRSKMTARLLFGPDFEILEDVQFREFERKIITIPALRLPIGFWLFVSRILWLLGFNSGGIESFAKARQRARTAAAFLADQAETHHNVVLVAHGFLNAFLDRELQRQGWQRIRQGGRGYLGVSLFTKVPKA